MNRSVTLFAQAQRHIPGGVNSPVRAFKAVVGTPRFFERAKGAYLWDADGQRYIDYMLSWSQLIARQAHPQILEAVTDALLNGRSFGAPTERESLLADIVSARVPVLDMIRFVIYGTEATMSAIRLARAFTGRDT